MEKNFKELEDVIGYSFTNKALLLNALTHSSYINEKRGAGHKDNERLEFFGDAIIEFYVSKVLFGKYGKLPEGELTKMRAALVCEVGLSQCARDIKLGDFLLMGKGEELTGGRERPSVTSDAFEALVAAIYLDSGMEEAGRFIEEHLLKDLEDKVLFYDAKSRLQEMAQSAPGNVLRYELVSDEGPVHERIFTMAAILNDVEIGRGTGRTKKEAQQNAAADAIKKIKRKNNVS